MTHPPIARTIAAGVALVLGLVACDSREWNPVITDARVLMGEWRDGRAALRLDASGGYECRGGAACDSLGARGTWARSGDFFLRFQPERGPAVEWRLSEDGGYYQLAAGETHGDPDMWRPRLTFKHQRPAA